VIDSTGNTCIFQNLQSFLSSSELPLVTKQTQHLV